MGIRINSQRGNDNEAAQEPEVPKLRFPQGTAALTKDDGKGNRVPLDDEEKVWLVNVSLSRVSPRDRDPLLKKDGKPFEHNVNVKALGRAEFIVQYARRALAAQEKQGAFVRLVVAPYDGNCQGKMKFTPRGTEKEWETCPYAKCGHHGDLPPNVYWSVWQAQHLISRLGSSDAITLFVEKYDQRPPVVAWGLKTRQDRINALAERMGLKTSRRTQDVTF